MTSDGLGGAEWRGLARRRRRGPCFMRKTDAIIRKTALGNWRERGGDAEENSAVITIAIAAHSLPPYKVKKVLKVTEINSGSPTNASLEKYLSFGIRSATASHPPLSALLGRPDAYPMIVQQRQSWKWEKGEFVPDGCPTALPRLLRLARSFPDPPRSARAPSVRPSVRPSMKAPPSLVPSLP